MFRKIAALLLCVLLFQGLASGRLHAASAYGSPRFEIGPYVSRITYDEPGSMKESGTMYGLDAAITWRGRYVPAFDSIRLEALAGRGTMEYSSTYSGTISGIDNTMFESRILFGRDFSRRDTTLFSSFIGFGYRYLTDKTGGLISTQGYYGYDRESQYLYLPIGLGASSKMDRGWSIDGSIEYDLFLKGTQTSHLTQASNSVYTYLNDVTNDQYSGNGVKVSLRFSKSLGDSGRLAFEPFLHYWNIGSSRYAYFSRTDNTGTQLYRAWEPENHSTEFGLRMLYLF